MSVYSASSDVDYPYVTDKSSNSYDWLSAADAAQNSMPMTSDSTGFLRELRGWEQISDEALRNFEAGLEEKVRPMEELKAILRDMLHDPRFWIAVVTGVNLIYTWFVPVKYIALLQVIDTVIVLFSSYLTARGAVRALRGRASRRAVLEALERSVQV